MQKTVRLLATLSLLMLIAAVCGSMALQAAPPAQEGSEQPASATNRDDEVVLLLSDGHIKIEDPFTPAGFDPAVWTSPSAGWTYVGLGDFNGDGKQEIIALSGSHAHIFDPFPQGATPVTFDVDIAPYVWVNAATGDIDGDGRDELILQRTDADTTNNITAHILVYKGNAAGTQWSVLRDLTYAAQWADMVCGNFIGDAKKELAMTRYDGAILMVINAQTGDQITSANFGEYFFKLAAGDVNRDGYDEILALRNVIAPNGANLVIFRVKGIGQGLETIYSQQAGAIFSWVTAGDYDGDGAAEAALLRNLDPPYKGLNGVDLISPLITLNEVIGTGWIDLRSGDIDGDGRAEILLLKDSSLVRAYRPGNPAPVVWQKSDAYKYNFAVGNVDGTGLISAPTLGVSPATLSFQSTYGGANPAPQTVTITNTTTTSSFGWTVTKSAGADWLIFQPASGNTPGSLQVSVDSSLASPGVNNATLTVAAAAGVRGSPKTISVTLTVNAPVLQVSPSRLGAVLRGDSSTVLINAVHITQVGGGSAIRWNATVLYKEQAQALLDRLDAVEDLHISAEGVDAVIDGQAVHIAAVPWLSISPTAGITPSDLRLTFDSTGQTSGVYNATILVDAGPGIGNRVGWCDVTLSVLRPGMFMPLLQNLYFGQ